MQKLNIWVFQAAVAVCNALALLLLPLRWGGGLVLGRWHWQAPVWLEWLGHRLAPLGRLAKAQAAWVLLASMLAAAAGGAYFLDKNGLGHWLKWSFWQQRLAKVLPDQGEIRNAEWTVTAPTRTPIEGDNQPRPVVVNFNASVAPLSLIGKAATGISLQPELAGNWRWVAANRLEFTPVGDWPIGTDFRIQIDPKALAPHIELNSYQASFTSPRFELQIAGATFYQDPTQVTLRKAVFEVTFSHPVNPDDFEKHLQLLADDAGWLPKKGPQKFTVMYDKLKLAATIHSEPLPIPPQTTSMRLQVAEGVKALRGGNPANGSLLALSIPGLYSLEITELKQTIVTGESGEPESLLQLTASMPVHEKEMARGINAWLLPAPANGNAWSNPEDVTEEVLKQSQKLSLTAVPGERDIIEGHSFKFKADAGRFLLVRLPKGLKSAGGYQLGAARDEILQVKQFAPELTIMSRGSLLALSGEKKLPIIVRDLPGIHIEIGRLLPQQLQHLITQSQGSTSKPEFFPTVTPDNLTERFEKKLSLSLKPGKTHYETVDFAEYLHTDAADRRGVFLLSVRGYDPKNSQADKAETWANPSSQNEGEGENDNPPDSPTETVDPATLQDRRLVIVTDLGIVAKQAVDGSSDVFVQSIANGQPVAGATVEVWAKNGSVLASQPTDANGAAHLPSLKGLQREKQPVVLVVRKAGDLSFLPLNRDRGLDKSRFDVGGIVSGGVPNQMRAYLFSDRGIYRPGDSMNIGIIVKAGDWAQQLADLPVEAEVIDPRGLVVRREKLKLGPGGMAELTHATNDSAPTGNYTINLNLGRDNGATTPGTPEATPLQLGTVAVKVQEFLPDRMKVSAKLSREAVDGWVSPKDLNAEVNVQNLFGTPAPQRRVEAKLTLSPAFPVFRNHRDFVFFDPQRAKESFSHDLGRSETDAQGNTSLNLGLQRYAAATYQLQLLVKAFEPEGGRSVAAEATTLVSDRPYLIGYKADGDLNYISRAAKRSVALLAIDPATKPTAAANLKLLRLERKVISVLVKQANGIYKYESRPKETVLHEEPYSLAANGNALVLATQTPGNFAYVLRNADGLDLARVEYNVVGSGNVSRSLDRNAELQLTLNKKEFTPGDEIEVSVRAPYTGAGLITIERDKVYSHRWFRAEQNSSVQKITLPKDFEGNGYVTVQFVRDLASDEIYMSPLSYGIAPFAVNLARRTSDIKLSSNDLLRPGQTAKFRLDAKKPVRAIVFAVDEGILQVARYQNPDPLKFFFQKRALEVSTQQTLDLLLPEFKKLLTAAAPGGDAEALLGKHLNPFKRKREKPVVYWSGLVDVNGSREFSYTVPESFNGALRVMAVAVSEAGTAAATARTTVRGDLILLPNLPATLTPGDEVDIGLGVANNTVGSGKNAVVNVTLAVQGGLEIVGPAQQPLKIGERSEASTQFRIRAKAGQQAQLGAASVVFSAQTGDARARLANEISVRPASAFVTQVQTGLVRGAGELTSLADLYPNFQRSELAVSTSPWAFTAGLIQYLEQYPHGCTEQITSQVFPAVILATQADLAQELLRTKSAVGTTMPVDPRKPLERYVTLVRARQSADGGIAMWQGGPADLYATAYVVNLLLEAKERQLAAPNDVLQRANTYLQGRLTQVAREDYNWRAQTYATYLLTRQNINVGAALTNLREFHRKNIETAIPAQKDYWRRDLGAVYLAASYQLLKQDALAQELLAPAYALAMTRTDVGRWTWNYYYDPLIHDTATLHLVARHFPEQLKQLPTDYWKRLSQVIRDGYFSSQSSASLILAVDAYASRAAETAAGKFDVATIDRQGVLQALALPPLLRLSKAPVPNNTAKLKLNNQGELPLFYAWSESGFERNAPTAVSQGLEVIHEFVDDKGNVVDQAHIGDELTVRIRVRATENRAMVPQVALVDVLPGGLEPVLNGAADSQAADQPVWRRRLGNIGSWAVDFADIREDRVVFYGSVNNSLTEVSYRVRASNSGDFVVPAAYAEAMYERRVFGRSAAGKFKVLPVKP